MYKRSSTVFFALTIWVCVVALATEENGTTPIAIDDTTTPNNTDIISATTASVPSTSSVSVTDTGSPTTVPVVTTAAATGTTAAVTTGTSSVPVSTSTESKQATTAAAGSTVTDLSTASTTTNKPHCTGFDAASFFGGIILGAGVLIIAFVLYRYCISKRGETPYHQF